MTVDRSLEVIRNYGFECQLDDPLSVIERMVKKYTFLKPEQRLALEVFMDATKEPM